MIIALTPLVVVRSELDNVDKVFSTMPSTEVLSKCKLLLLLLYLFLTDMNKMMPSPSSCVEAQHAPPHHAITFGDKAFRTSLRLNEFIRLSYKSDKIRALMKATRPH